MRRSIARILMGTEFWSLVPPAQRLEVQIARKERDLAGARIDIQDLEHSIADDQCYLEVTLKHKAILEKELDALYMEAQPQ